MNCSPYIKRLVLLASNEPSKIIVIDESTESKTTTCLEILESTTAYSKFFGEYGVKPKDYVLISLPPSRILVELVYALFYIGAIPVFLDPNTPKNTLEFCIKELKPILAISNSNFPIVKTLRPNNIRKNSSKLFDNKPYSEYSNDSAVMLMYTSGTTGMPKPARWTYKNVESQLEIYDRRKSCRELTLFPLFVLNSVAIGCTALIPNLKDFSPRNIDMDYLVDFINRFMPDFIFASPELWRRYLSHVDKKNHMVSYDIAIIATAGASIGRSFLIKLMDKFTDTKIKIPYAATEGLMPLAEIDAKEFIDITENVSLSETGIPLGKISEGVACNILPMDFGKKIINSSDFLQDGITGEIVMSGNRISPVYEFREDYNNYSKLFTEKRELWHKMGDIGYLKNGYLWLRCRKKDFITFDGEFFFPDQLEQEINDKLECDPCACLIHNNKINVVFNCDNSVISKGIKEIQSYLDEIKHGMSVVVIDQKIPVDSRHHSKIDRSKLNDLINRENFE